MAETNKKSVKIGTIFKKKDGEKTAKLGQENPGKPEYNYTVEVRVKNAKGDVIAKVTNPWVNLNAPHPKAPGNLLNELVIWVDNES